MVKRAESERNEKQLRDRGRTGDGHQHRIILARADDRHDRLDQRQREREHEGVVPELGDHDRGSQPPVPGEVQRADEPRSSGASLRPALSRSACFLSYSSFQWPCFFKLSATSFGI